MTRRDAWNEVWTRAASTALVGIIALFALAGWLFVRSDLAAWESASYPVLKDVVITDGAGETRRWPAFAQTEAVCDGRDALVSGLMSKVRDDAEYVVPRVYAMWSDPNRKPEELLVVPENDPDKPVAGEGHQMFFGKPDGDSRRAYVVFADNPPKARQTRPAGVQDWGPWRLVGGCDTRFTTWFSTVEHVPWHRAYHLSSTLGPFPLPAHPSG